MADFVRLSDRGHPKKAVQKGDKSVGCHGILLLIGGLSGAEENETGNPLAREGQII